MAIKAVFTVLMAGRELAKPGAWKNGAIWGNLLLAGVMLADYFGVRIPLVEEDAMVVGAGIAALLNVYFIAATSKKVGIPSNDLPPIDLVSQPDPDPDPDPERVRRREVPSSADGGDRFGGHNG
jgi:hypothetical protein